MTCDGRPTTIKLDTAEFVDVIKRVEKMLDDFARGVGTR